MSVREMHNSLVSDPNDSVIKDARDEYDNIIISYSTLRSMLKPQLKQMLAQHKVMCGCECCIYAKNIHPSLISWSGSYLKKFKYKGQNYQNRKYDEKSHHI